MAKVKAYSTFVRGLITEASALTFPENASLDEDNFVLNRNGSRQRRLGMDYEVGYALAGSFTDAVLKQSAINTHRWDNVNNDPTLSFTAVQVGESLLVYDTTTSSISANLLTTITLTLIDSRDNIETAVIDGDLVLSQGGVGDYSRNVPLRIHYNGSTFDTPTPINIKVRDFWGVNDGLEIDERISTSNTEHFYNLANQGWSQASVSSTGVDATYFTLWATGNDGDDPRTDYPSNADQYFVGKDAEEDFKPSLVVKNAFGTTLSPRGQFILNAFERGAERVASFANKPLWPGTVDSVTGIPSDREQGYIKSIASYAGRIFYSGVLSNIYQGDTLSPSYTGYIFFSQLVDNFDRLSKCYQDADPTSEHITDLIDTDGGYVNIPEASNIIKLIPLADALLVFAENGVWEIRGGTDGGFKATDHQVRKITSVGSTAQKSIVAAESSVFYWTDGGIYVIQPNQTSGYLTSTNLTETTIQTLYTEIPGVARTASTGVYDSSSKQVRWSYNDTAGYDGVDFSAKYNRELVFDTVLQAFYPSSIDVSSDYIAGYVRTPDFVSADVTDDVTVGGVTVTVSGVPVSVTTSVRSRGVSTLKYLTIVPGSTNTVTFSHYRRDDFMDWYTTDSTGLNFSSYLLTGYEIMGDASRDKQATYLTMHFNRTETGFSDAGSGNLTALNQSSCLVQAQWDFADHINSGKFGTQFQTYRLRREYIPTGVGDTFDYGQSVITTKSKLRGRGKALSLRIESEQGKDMYLLGWSIPFTGEAEV